MRLDLHIHTTASDGHWSPEEVVAAAASGGLDAIAIADHDTTAAVPAATLAAASHGVRLLPAIELSTSFQGREVHVLGYRVDPASPDLQEHERRARGARLARIERMVGRLRGLGVVVRMEAVLAAAGGASAVIGRPHLARALVEAGHAASVSEAFDRFIGDGLPAFEPTAWLTPEEGVELVLRSGGFAVWAHPPGDLLDALLPRMVRSGLRGIEVYRPLSSAEQVRRLERVARSAGLFTSGGSDWHSPERNAPLGAFFVDSQRIQGFLDASGLLES